MEEKLKKNHYILSLRTENSGSYEHAWNLAKNLNKRGIGVDYFSHWWNEKPSKIDLDTKKSQEIDVSILSNKKGIFHLQTHTWEHEGLLEKIFKENNEKTLIYNLHAIIPYFYLDSNLKQPFLNGEISYLDIKDKVESKMSQREKSQLKAFEKADHLFAISKNHKKVIGLMGIDVPTHVFENLSDFEEISPEIDYDSNILAKNLREELQVDNVLLYCGRVENGKGNQGMFDALRKIVVDNPSTKMIIVGEGEDKKEKLFAHGLEKELLPYLKLVSWIDKHSPNAKKEFLKYYKASDVLIQPMITKELYAKTVIDAMALGLPTITTESPYTIGSSKNANEIYDSYNFLNKNPEKVKKIIESAKEKIKRENTWDSYISRLEKIIN